MGKQTKPMTAFGVKGIVRASAPKTQQALSAFGDRSASARAKSIGKAKAAKTTQRAKTAFGVKSKMTCGAQLKKRPAASSSTSAHDGCCRERVQFVSGRILVTGCLALIPDPCGLLRQVPNLA